MKVVHVYDRVHTFKQLIPHQDELRPFVVGAQDHGDLLKFLVDPSSFRQFCQVMRKHVPQAVIKQVLGAKK